MDQLLTFFQECEAAYHSKWGEKASTLVFGDGMTKSPRLMLVGEAPGEQEALQRKPFVGKAGKNLNEFLAAIGLPREELYITNVVKLRPSRISAAGRIVNRPPSREEIAFFRPWLYREVSAVHPHALVTLGNVALNAFLPNGSTIGSCHGRWQSITVDHSEGGVNDLPLFALYHPASVIYNRALAATYQADLATLRDTLAAFDSRTDS